MSTFTPNKAIEQPASGAYVNDWDVPVNADWAIIDSAFGGTTSISVTGVGAGTVTLTTTQYTPPNIEFSGVLSANLVYQVPTGVGGCWSISNATTGAFTLKFAIVSGNNIILAANRTLIISNGAAIAVMDSGTYAAAQAAATTAQTNAETYAAAQAAAALAAAEASAASLYAPMSTGTFSPSSWSGFSSPPSISSVSYSITGKIAVIQFPGGISTWGTSNSGQFQMNGLPANLQPASIRWVPIIGLINGGTPVTGVSSVAIAGAAISFFPDGSGQPAWTPSGNKGFYLSPTLIYSL